MTAKDLAAIPADTLAAVGRACLYARACDEIARDVMHWEGAAPSVREAADDLADTAEENARDAQGNAELGRPAAEVEANARQCVLAHADLKEMLETREPPAPKDGEDCVDPHCPNHGSERDIEGEEAVSL